eukprot:6178741-Pleurochrysis_carterae.AAC.1
MGRSQATGAHRGGRGGLNCGGRRARVRTRAAQKRRERRAARRSESARGCRALQRLLARRRGKRVRVALRRGHARLSGIVRFRSTVARAARLSSKSVCVSEREVCICSSVRACVCPLVCDEKSAIQPGFSVHEHESHVA